METAPNSSDRAAPAPPAGGVGALGAEHVVPQSIEMESCVLGTMMLYDHTIDIVVQILQPEFFHRPAHQVIFDTLVRMRDKNQPIDLVSLREDLERENQFERIGGVEYLLGLAERVPSSANIEYYAGIVRDKALLRELIRAGGEITSNAYDSSRPAQEIIDEAEKQIFDIGAKRISSGPASLKTLLEETFQNLEENAGKVITGIPSGFQMLDRLTAGFQDEELIIIAARPSMGKTSLLLNIAEHITVVEKQPLAMFSLEMSQMQIAQRLLASHAQFDLRKFRDAISPETWTQLQTAAGNLYEAEFLIDDSSMLTPMQLRAKARRMKAERDIQCILIDYIQLMSPSPQKSNTKRYEQLGEMSRHLKALARELKIPVVCAAQLNRSPADRPTHTPRMSDLRESGSLEQDADVVMLIHCEDYYHKGEDDYEKENITKLIVEKQRNGPTGVVNLTFRPEITRFEQAAPEYMVE